MRHIRRRTNRADNTDHSAASRGSHLRIEPLSQESAPYLFHRPPAFALRDRIQADPHRAAGILRGMEGPWCHIRRGSKITADASRLAEWAQLETMPRVQFCSACSPR